MKITRFIFICTFFMKRSFSDSHFCYDNARCGEPSPYWGGTCQTGLSQSPIDLTEDFIQPHVLELPLTHFVADHFFMQNDGHTLNIDVAAENEEQDAHFFPGFGISPIKYRLSNIHFHWGRGDHNGSEHAANGKKFTMKVHFVHYNEKYSTSDEAIKSGDPYALAVVAIFLQSHPSATPSLVLRPIISNLDKVKEVNPYWYRVKEVLNLNPLIPQNGDLLYSYRGSITTPGCNEQVSWFVFREPVPILPEAVSKLRTLMDGEGENMSRNNRPLQDLNGRTVWLHSVVRGDINICLGGPDVCNDVF